MIKPEQTKKNIVETCLNLLKKRYLSSNLIILNINSFISVFILSKVFMVEQ